MNCKHHWIIEDDKNYHQVGRCKKCGEVRDYGINPTVVTDRVIVTTDFRHNPFTGKLVEFPTLERREYQYPEPKRGFVIPFEPDENDENLSDQFEYGRYIQHLNDD